MFKDIRRTIVMTCPKERRKIISTGLGGKSMANFEVDSSFEHPDISRTRSLLIGIGGVTAILGVLAVILPISIPLTTNRLFGWLFVSTGLLQIAFSFTSGRWSGFAIHLFLGFFYSIGGGLIVFGSPISSLTLKIILGIMFFTIGVFRTLLSLTVRFETWRWALQSGLVTLALALYCFISAREASPSLIGTIVAIDLICFSAYLLAFVFSLGHQKWTPELHGHAVRS